MPSTPEPAIALGLQLGVSALFVLLMTVIHALGLLGISQLLDLDNKRLEKHEMNFDAIMLLAGLGVCVFLLHFLEIALFGAFYLAIGGVESVEEALFFSASSYATLGRMAEYFPPEWRLMGAVEALIGFILIGWSTAFMVNTMRKLTD